MYFNLIKATLIVALTGSVAAWSMPWSNINIARRDGYDDFAILPIPVYKGNDKSYHADLAKYEKELEAGLKKTKEYIEDIKESKNVHPKKHSRRDDKKDNDKDTNDAKKDHDEQVKKHNDEVKKVEENIKDHKEKYPEDVKSDKKDIKEDIKKDDTKTPSVDDIKKAEEKVKKQQKEAIKSNKAAAKEATDKNRGKN